MYSDALNAIFTISDQEEFLSAIDILRNSLYSKDIDLKNSLKKIDVRFATVIQEYLENAADKGKLLDELRLSVKSMRVLNLRLGYVYDLEFAAQMGDWVKDNIGGDVVLELEIDPSLIGGAQVSFNGVFRDYSLKSSLEKIWNN